MKKAFRIISITVLSIFFCWYLSLYFTDFSWPNQVIETHVPLNRCSLDEVSWLVKSIFLYNGPKGENLYLADGPAKESETTFWLLDSSRNTCMQTAFAVSKDEFQMVPSSVEHYFPIVEPPMFSRGHIIQSTQYRGSVSARCSFRGIHLKRPVYLISFMGGGTRWGIASSYIGTFYLEVYRGTEKIFVIGKNVYGATWGPSVTADYLTYDAVNRFLVFNDRFYEPSVVYWTRLKE